MNRRSFLAVMGSLPIATSIPSILDKKKYKLGLQLFSIHQDMMDDPAGTLRKVKKMGYQDFEIYGFDPEKLTYYNLPAKDFRHILNDLGLTASSGHYGFSDYLMQDKNKRKRFVDQCIQGAMTLNTPYITWPWLDPSLRNLNTFKRLTGVLNEIGEQVNAAGLGFAYHNHGFEFEDHDGENGYDIIIKETDPQLVKLQMDMYWVMHSSRETPKEMVARQPGRFVMWHIKDMDKVTRDYTELGNGSIDYTQIMPDPIKSGLEYYYIEQGGNFTKSAMQSAATSAEYFKKNLQHLI